MMFVWILILCIGKRNKLIWSICYCWMWIGWFGALESRLVWKLLGHLMEGGKHLMWSLEGTLLAII
ncbi:hypothetical protein T12_8631 [Trichinella patagoniensis]|uniref:Uncharacterized protein n=1 Tax=Trichinella patagoniensis TaxID=990121 RepID=A0A0V0XDB8_9BILA|nr:hypothetical protein T12_8631 [Trichinella patagoniensis]